MKRATTVTGALILALSACAVYTPAGIASSTGPAATSPATVSNGVPKLPKPTGSHPVGTTSLHVKDASRPDPWIPEAKERELMVSLWYPAKAPNGRRAPYMTAKESELILKGAEITGVPYDALSKTRTNAFLDAKPAGRKRSLPLVVLSPGFTEPRSSLTALAEDLASRGYVVAGIEHTYESLATSFPDGRVTTCAACQDGKGEAFWAKLGQSRAADVSFVLDKLTGTHPKWKSASLIDNKRIAMAGQSAGGASTITAMLKDTRVRAGINMDGTTFAPIPDSGLSRPFVFLGTQAMHSPGGKDTTWERDWAHLTGWKRWLVVAGAEHASFTDTALLVEQLGIYRNPNLTAARAVEITRAYTRAFFNQHLRNRPQPSLNKPSTRYPEVKLCSVRTKTCS
ncbi:alpha/beta hydrolase [Nonomuraea sp. KC401]|uniref:alpha/beta hydrolase family protein n=1 Tax=unclassified Nonomuraea TaxID=2593643 RepID=UPI0010FEBC36|nr:MULTISPECIES: alpha/beta hydrolase [unclassified Nonomuraea]NBE96916.1 alpha/beta hydrolase [Nonomuraea sp. K271]TLF66317.1 alpha/beta hydrolase [Nonomuraea sp. KC401]